MHLSLIVSLMSVVVALTESIQQFQLQHEEKQRVKNWSLHLDYNVLKKTMTKERKVKKLLECCKASIFNTKNQ